MNATIVRLQEERAACIDFIDQTLAGVEAETRDLSDTEKRSVETQHQRIAEIDAQLEPLTQFEERRSAVATALGGVTTSPRPTARDERTIGEQFLESEQFRGYTGTGTSGRFDIPDAQPWDEQVQTRATLTNASFTNLTPQTGYLWTPQHFVNFPLLSLVQRVDTTNTSIELITIGEASGHDVVAEGAAKPEVNWTETVSPYTLAMVAGWKKATRQVLDDIPQMRSIIDRSLQRSLLKKMNALAVAAVNGAITGGNTTTGAAGVKGLPVLRNAIGELQARGVMPNAVLINPADYAAIDIDLLEQTLNGAVMNGSAFGIRFVPDASVTAGSFIVGDFNLAVTWVSKGGQSLYITDSDISGDGTTATSDFRHNILTFLLEQRSVFVPTDASALQKAVVTP